MKRITVNEYTNCDFVDVYFVDIEKGEGIQDFEQGLSYDQANDYIIKLIKENNMNNSHKITSHYFDNKEYLIESKKITIAEYKELMEV